MAEPDIWSLSPTSAPQPPRLNTGAGGDVAQDLVVTTHDIPDIDDLYRNAPSDKPMIAPELQDVLFARGQHTFFLVDATLRTNVTGSFDLHELDLPTRSLFIGDAAERFAQVAPYLIDMTLPDAAWDDPTETPAFHVEFFKRHWQQGTGIFIRTPASMDEVWANFRKFTKVRMGDGRVSYFRFWDTSMLMYFLQACTVDELDRFFVTGADVFCTGRPSKFHGGVVVQSARRGAAG